MTSKKGATQQAFVYAVSAIIIIAVLLFGYSTISSLQQTKDSRGEIQFKTKLQNDIEIASQKYGSVNSKSYTIPNGYTKLCFINPENVGTDDIENPIINNSVRNGLKQNVFLFGDNKKPIQLHIKNLRLKFNPYYKCLDVSGKRQFELNIEGGGNKAWIRFVEENVCRNADEADNPDQACAVLNLHNVGGRGYSEVCCAKYQYCC